MNPVSIKRLVCIALALGLTGPLDATPSTQDEPRKPQFCWSLLWGAYTRDGCPKTSIKEKTGNSVATGMAEAPIRSERENPAAAPSDQEVKSVLFGAVQWTAKKTTAGKTSEGESRDIPQ